MVIEIGVPVQPTNVLGAVFEGAGFLGLLTAAGGGFAFREFGAGGGRRVFRVAMVLAFAFALALAWLGTNATLPRIAPND